MLEIKSSVGNHVRKTTTSVISHSWSCVRLLIAVSSQLRVDKFTRLTLAVRMMTATRSHSLIALRFCSIHVIGASDSMRLHHSRALMCKGRRIRYLRNESAYVQQWYQRGIAYSLASGDLVDQSDVCCEICAEHSRLHTFSTAAWTNCACERPPVYSNSISLKTAIIWKFLQSWWKHGTPNLLQNFSPLYGRRF